MDGQREPALSPDEAAHGERVRAHIAAAIRAAGGWLSFERYMDLALYAPGLGYYSGGAQKLGIGGDFTTAPEVSRLFGGCVARQCAQVLERLEAGSILEIGAGSGRLAADLLLRLATLGRLPERYMILDVSADLRARQALHLRTLPVSLRERVVWLDAPPSACFDGVVLANEVLDALPVQRFRRAADATFEIGVGLEDEAFVWSAVPADAALAAACARLERAAAAPWRLPYESEYCPRLAAWAGSVTAALRRGVVLWFDYGLPRSQYYLPERSDGTLICHFKHRVELDALRRPGLQDITAWVDFTALAEAGRASGFELAGFTTQTYFLTGAGLEQELGALAAEDPARAARLGNEARQLVLPGDMGERFKAMAWQRGIDANLSGFSLRDLRHSL
jgi:SAM-dependent MidA family methyltransferase